MINWIVDCELMTDDEPLREYRASTAEATEARQTALAAEIEKRNLDL